MHRPWRGSMCVYGGGGALQLKPDHPRASKQEHRTRGIHHECRGTLNVRGFSRPLP